MRRRTSSVLDNASSATSVSAMVKRRSCTGQTHSSQAAAAMLRDSLCGECEECEESAQVDAEPMTLDFPSVPSSIPQGIMASLTKAGQENAPAWLHRHLATRATHQMFLMPMMEV